MSARRRWLVVVTLAALTTVAAACGSSSSTSSGGGATTTTVAATTTTALDKVAAEAEIRDAFTKFFDGTNPDNASKIALVEDADVLAPLYQASSAANADFAAKTSANVKTVTFTSDTTADVTYDVLVSGTPALSDFAGSAILINGKWLITKAAFCDITFYGATQPPECTS
jgi:ABC-type oligopeptide transport system substrate-binding subunit